MFKFVAFLFILIILQCYGGFVIPEITLEAYKPKGFKASIPDMNGIRVFSFHGNLNKELVPNDAGDFNGECLSPSNNTWSYVNKDLILKVGDVIHYWIFIQHNALGYVRHDQKWTVKEFQKNLNYTQVYLVEILDVSQQKGIYIQNVT